MISLKYIAIILVVVASCTTQKKANRYFNEHMEQAAQYCATVFPAKDSTIVRDSISFDTLYVEGEPEILRDSFYIKGDTIIRQTTKKCPAAQTITKTVRHDSIIIRRDRAQEYVLESSIAKLRAENLTKENLIKGLEAKVKDKNRWIGWMIVALVLSLGWNFRKLIIRLVSPVRF